MAQKNAPKSLISAPSIVLTTENGGISVEPNSANNAYVIGLKMLVGAIVTKSGDNGKTWDTAGEAELPEMVEINGVKYWINLSSGWVETKSGRRKVGKPRITFSPVKEQPAKTTTQTSIPW